jgi:hypothetical protein
MSQPASASSISALSTREQRARGRDDFYLIAIFKDYAERTDFLAKCGLVDNRYRDGNQLAFAIARVSATAAFAAANNGSKQEGSTGFIAKIELLNLKTIWVDRIYDL